MAEAKTRSDLIAEAYSILAATDTPPAVEDVATIGSQVEPLVEQLSADNIITIDPDEIPSQVFMPLVRLLANVCGPKYGSPMNEAAKLMDESTLRRMNSGRPTFEVIRAEYF